MIDFANTILGTKTNDETSQSLNKHNGPDKGYLYGLEHLIGLFRGILNDSEKKATTITEEMKT
jgi:hypothetical protein